MQYVILQRPELQDNRREYIVVIYMLLGISTSSSLWLVNTGVSECLSLVVELSLVHQQQWFTSSGSDKELHSDSAISMKANVNPF